MSKSRFLSEVLGGLTILDFLDVNNARLTEVADPINPSDAATKNYVDTTISHSNLLPGTGLDLVNNYFNVLPSQTQITQIGNINSGFWEASTILVPYGGTGTTNFTPNKLLLGNGSNTILTTSKLTYDDIFFTVDTPIIITNTTLATSNTNGALYIAGGANIKKNLLVYQDATISGNMSVSNLNISGSLSLSSVVSNSSNFTNTTINNLLSNNIVSSNFTTTNLQTTNVFSTYSTLGNLYVNSLSILSTTNMTSISTANAFIKNSVITGITLNNLLLTYSTISNMFNNNSTINSLSVPINLNSPFNILQNITSTNLLSTNISSTNNTKNNILNINLTSSNSVLTNLTSNNVIINNTASISSITSNSIYVSNNAFIPNIQGNNNLINTNITNSNIINQNLSNTNLTTSNLVNNFATQNNSIVTNSTINNLNVSNSTFSNLKVINYTNLNNLSTINLTSSNLIVSNNISSNSLITTTISTNNLNVSGPSIFTSISTNNLWNDVSIFNNSSMNTLNLSGNLTNTGGTILTNNITCNNLYTSTLNKNINLFSTNATLNNIVSSLGIFNTINTNYISGGSIYMSGLTRTTNLYNTNFSNSNLISTYSTISNLLSTNLNNQNMTSNNTIVSNSSINNLNTNLVTIGSAYINSDFNLLKNLILTSTYQGSPSSSSGSFLFIAPSTFINNTSTSTSNVNLWTGNYFSSPTLAAQNNNITTNKSATIYIQSNVQQGANQTILYNSGLALGYTNNNTGGSPNYQLSFERADGNWYSGMYVESVTNSLNIINGSISGGGGISLSSVNPITFNSIQSSSNITPIPFINFSSNKTSFLSTTPTTSASTGSIVINGGLGTNHMFSNFYASKYQYVPGILEGGSSTISNLYSGIILYSSTTTSNYSITFPTGIDGQSMFVSTVRPITNVTLGNTNLGHANMISNLSYRFIFVESLNLWINC
jgi:trimeric autotransporter adhesin